MLKTGNELKTVLKFKLMIHKQPIFDYKKLTLIFIKKRTYVYRTS